MIRLLWPDYLYLSEEKLLIVEIDEDSHADVKSNQNESK
jgi:hypothetical protein